MKRTPWVVRGLALLALATMATGCPDDDLENEIDDIGAAVEETAPSRVAGVPAA